MARPLRKGRDRRPGYWASPRVLLLLLDGHDFEFLDPSLGPEGQLDRELLAEAWEENRERILDWHTNGLPGDNPMRVNPCEGQPGKPWGWREFEGGNRG
jgi:hypothetical protein